MKISLKYFILFAFPFAFQLIVSGNEGESLFIENCAICHTIGQGDLIGPDLKNIHKNRSIEYFQSFVINSQKVIKSGDSIAVSVFRDYNESIMPEHSLSEAEIIHIWQFIQTFEGNAYYEYSFPITTVKTSNKWLKYVLAIFVLAGVVIFKRKWLILHLESFTKKIPFQRVSARTWKSLLILSLVLFVLIILNNNGVFTGYQPNQPILFSHKVHCSQNEISCKYCHSEAYKGEHGGIPSLSICMNCHKYVNKGTLFDTVEIAKLHEWAGFDSKSKEYNKEQTQMGWIKVHNLPDYSRFNHQIHTYANVSCTECHGIVEDMTKIKQVKPLTMKWCVDCHTKREIPLVGYYSENDAETKNVHAISNEERANFTLRTDTLYNIYKNLGGLDCYKCHN